MHEALMQYTFNGTVQDIPNEFLYMQSNTKEWAISEEFFTWAFDKHGVSMEVVLMEVVQDSFVVQMKAIHGGNLIKTALGDAAIDETQKGEKNWIQTAFRRAKVNVGKEVFGLTELKNAMTPRHYRLSSKDHDNKTLGQLYVQEGREKVESLLMASDFRTTRKVQDFLKQLDSKRMATDEQLKRLSDIRNTYNVPASYYSKLTETVFEKDFSYKEMSYADADLLLDILVRKYEKGNA